VLLSISCKVYFLILILVCNNSIMIFTSGILVISKRNIYRFLWFGKGDTIFSGDMYQLIPEFTESESTISPLI
jgi:bacteriorhodopsin